jgi:hypothetical protein
LASVARVAMQSDQSQSGAVIEFVVHAPSGQVPCGHCLEAGGTDPNCRECEGRGYLPEGLSAGSVEN